MLTILTKFASNTYVATVPGQPGKRATSTAGGRSAALAWIRRHTGTNLAYDSPALVTSKTKGMFEPEQHTYDPAALAPQPGQLNASWDRARQLFELVRGFAAAGIAAQVLLGAELHRRKQELGFVHGANRTGPSGQFGQSGPSRQIGDSVEPETKPRTWPEWLQAELGLADRTADRFITMANAARARLKKLGEARALELIDTPWLTLQDAARADLMDIVRRITDGDTQADLLRELQLIPEQATIGGATPRPEKLERDEQQLSFEFFAPAWESICTIRHRSDDLTRYLHFLPLQPDTPGGLALTTLEVELEATLKEVRTARQQRLNPDATNVIDITP